LENWLLELECAKNGGGLSGLKVLDEPAFLKPLLVKLPDDLQGRWQRHAYRYKVQKVADYVHELLLLTVHEFSTGSCLFILFIYLFLLIYFLYFLLFVFF